ncbi:MAG: protein translocase subunit SecD [Nocardioidaceae bacterium]|nr:protein translocase subunit SecD [Nocardioidaceae bacterium]
MARQQARPGRTLVVFFLALAVAFGLVALIGTWKPALGLDLRGGTRIQMKAEGNPTESALKEAAAIIDQRVNGSGVSEAEVTTDSNGYITVEIPGQNRADLVETVKRQAQLRFRLVADTGVGTPAVSGSPTTSPGAGVLLPTPTATKSPTADASTSPSAKPSSKGRAPYAADSSPAGASPSDSAAAGASDSAPASDSAGASDGASPSDGASTPAGGDQPTGRIAQELAWVDAPDAASTKAFTDYSCPQPGEAVKSVVDNPDKPLVTCDQAGSKYLLSKALIEGTQLKTAAANPPDQSHSGWYVTLSFDGSATQSFGQITTALYNNGNNFAVVLDGQVIESAGVNEPILGGSAEITGGFTEASAKSLATSLKYGALPISFGEPLTETVGPSLAGNQLSGGILAGLLGLILVMIYSLFYYRGLGITIIASLLIAGAWTYALVLLLAKTAGFTLTLPGIAGLIVAVGITADSFIVYFERIRDEMRDGKSMRVAVEAGWKRAWRTCVAADTVSLLAAVVLYVFAAGVVKGFAFALGLSTLIDLLVFYFFTHPLVSYLAHFPFFNKGHKLSGLDAEHLGIDALPAGGRA